MSAIMKRRLVIFILLALTLKVAKAKFCEDTVHLKLEGRVEVHSNNGSITHNKVEYPKGAHWKEGKDFYGCPCKVKQCVRICNETVAIMTNFTIPDENFQMQIWHEEQLKSVNLHDHFITIKEAKCENGILLEPEFHEPDTFNILANGTLHYTHLQGDGQQQVLQLASDYCILNDDSTVVVISCLADEEMKLDKNKPQKIQFYLYPVFMIISIFFLLLTLVAFFVTPALQNLHGKSIACQSGALMIGFIAFTVTYLAGASNSIVVCKIFAYLAFIFMLSSFYWLNTMCFDIFWTFSDFKKMTGSLQNTHKKKFRMYTVYSTTNPLFLSISFIVMDNVLDEKSSLWPGIGEQKCWFRSLKTEFLFYQGPILFLLMANIIFFSITIFKFLKMKRESAVLKRGDSMTHNGSSGEMEDRQRFKLYVKLFLLMGGTWLLEIISWWVGGPAWIWIFTDLINCSRGVLIFYFCVWSNKKVRNSLLSRFCSKYASKYVVDGKKQSFTSKTSAMSECSGSHNENARVALKSENRENDDETAL